MPWLFGSITASFSLTKTGVGNARRYERSVLIYGDISPGTAIFKTASPNTRETETFIRTLNPDIILGALQGPIKRERFSISSKGTFVMHPGICPEYRNAHGCFWALANRELNKVGMTLLKVDKGCRHRTAIRLLHPIRSTRCMNRISSSSSV